MLFNLYIRLNRKVNKMSGFLVVLIIVFVVFLISFVFIGVGYLIKGKEFKKTCSTSGEECTCKDEKLNTDQCENIIHH